MHTRAHVTYQSNNNCFFFFGPSTPSSIYYCNLQLTAIGRIGRCIIKLRRCNVRHGTTSTMEQGNRTKFIQIAPIVRAYGRAYVRSCGATIKIEETTVLTATWCKVDDFLRTEHSHEVLRTIFLTFSSHFYFVFFFFAYPFALLQCSIENEWNDEERTEKKKKTNRRTFVR